MKTTLACPVCKKSFQLPQKELADHRESFACCLCGNTLPPDIGEAYQNIGKSLTELQGCCACPDKKAQQKK